MRDHFYRCRSKGRGIAIPILLLVVASCFVTAASATAAVITATLSGSVVDNFVPPIGVDGYQFYSLDPVGGATPDGALTGTDVTVLPSYVTSITNPGALKYGSGDLNTGYSDITLGGTPPTTTYNTGVVYKVAQGNALLATIILGAIVPADGFRLGVLTENGDIKGTEVTVSSPTGNSIPTTFGTALATNRFYMFDITNLSPGDVINVSVQEGLGHRFSLIGGLTFDPLIPEPGTVSLVSMVGSMLLLRRRR